MAYQKQFIASATLFITLLCSTIFAAELEGLGRPGESDSAYQVRTKWFQDAKFGMFIHWGAGCLYKDGVGGNLSWNRPGTKPHDIRDNKPAEFVYSYDTNYHHFNPTKFDAMKIAKGAKDAGMKYIVVIGKHHEGFAMFDTKQKNSRQKMSPDKAKPYDTCPYGITHSKYGKDPMKMWKAACSTYGLKLGIYYSPRDWFNPDYGVGDNSVYDEFLRAQVQEILDQYDPDIMWWDSFGKHPESPKGTTAEKQVASRKYWKTAEILRWVEVQKPDILNNNRCIPLEDWNSRNTGDKGDSRGDFDTPEGSSKYDGRRAGEACISTVNGWSWHSSTTKPKRPARIYVEDLISMAVKGGNLLLNFGPTPEGELLPPFYDLLDTLGTWMKTNGDAIYGTRMGPETGDWVGTRKGHEGENGGTTIKDSSLYVLIINWGSGNKVQLTLPKGVSMTSWNKLSDGEATVTASGQTLTIALKSGVSPNPIADAFEIKTDSLLYDSQKYVVGVKQETIRSFKGVTAPSTFAVSGDRFVLPSRFVGKATPVALFDLAGRCIGKKTISSGEVNIKRDFNAGAGVHILHIQ